MGSPSEHRFSTQVMNICIVFNSFSVVLLQQIQRVLHFTLDNESLSTVNWRATKKIRGPRAHVLWRGIHKLGLFSLVKRRTRGTLILLTNVWRANKDDRTKLFLVISVDTARPQTAAWGTLSLYPNSVSGLSASVKTGVYSFHFQLYFPSMPFKKMLSEHTKNAALQCLLIKMRAYVGTKMFFSVEIILIWSSAFSMNTVQFTLENLLCINYRAHLCSGPGNILPDVRW